jgi:hypothetical protein
MRQTRRERRHGGVADGSRPRRTLPLGALATGSWLSTSERCSFIKSCAPIKALSPPRPQRRHLHRTDGALGLPQQEAYWQRAAQAWAQRVAQSSPSASAPTDPTERRWRGRKGESLATRSRSSSGTRHHQTCKVNFAPAWASLKCVLFRGRASKARHPVMGGHVRVGVCAWCVCMMYRAERDKENATEPAAGVPRLYAD